MIGDNRDVQPALEGGAQDLLSGDDVETDDRTTKRNEFWGNQEPKETHDYRNFTKSS